ncbi:MAG TPA: AraC family transcriptional regulator ligand-binding domain-containing protein [Anaeromyxobacter sp.]|nr:AraC family transcriptional regulator ligand-binding domain-containing protein [Anaeromyxobacter sp.]
MLLPAATPRAVLAGFRALGLDAEAIRAAAGLTAEELAPVDALVPSEAFGRLWAEAMRRGPRDELVTEVGLAIPFGAFGPIDYLAGSSPTVSTAFQALAAHFRYVALGIALELAEDPQSGEVRLLNEPDNGDPVLSDEFTLAVFVGRFRTRTGAVPFRVDQVRLTRPPPARPTRHAALLGAPVTFGCKVSALRFPAPVWRAALPSADAGLLAILRQLAEHAGLGGAREDDLVVRVRSRMRLLLPDGRASAAEVAGALGVSERTLHRRLQAAGASFRSILESFREAEAERLIGAGRLPLGEVALRLGFSDQTAWNRAFRRWKGMSPTEWVERRALVPRSP